MQERHLDPTHMILCWLKECRITEGYLFHKFLAEDRISMNDKPLVLLTFVMLKPSFIL